MTSHSGFFDLGDAAIRLVTPDAETIKSLQGFFDPYVPTIAHAEDFYQLTTVFDPRLFEATKTSLPATPDCEIVTTLQHDLEYQLKCFKSSEGMLIYDEQLQVIYHVREQTTQVVATEGSRVRTALLRIIRGAWILGQAGLILHGCALEKNGNGIIISGDKYAGKTTSLLSLSLKGYNIIANDRLLLSQSGVARGIPTVVKLRPRTLTSFPPLRHLLDWPIFGVSDLARELKVMVKKEAAIKAMTFLRYDESLRAPVFRKLSLDEASRVLSSHLFARREYEWVKLMKIGDSVPDPTEVRIPSVMSCFRVSCNENHTDEVARRLDDWCQTPGLAR